ncbi:MAG: VanW family protein [Candidatus Gracilibacteria bacterium]|jgi:vancomycin resistance protein YoaR
MTSPKKNSKIPEWNTVKNGAKKKLLRGGLYFAGIIAVSSILIVVDLHSDQRVYPRVYAGPVALGYLTTDDAVTLLNKKVETYETTPIVFSFQGKELAVTPKELGITFANQRVINNLPIYHFTASKALSFVGGFLKEEHFALAYAMDGEKVLNVLEEKFGITGQRAKNARLISKNKKLEIQPEVNGTVFDRPELLRMLEKYTQNLQNGVIELNIIPENASITATTLTAGQGRFQAAMTSPITLKYDGRNYKIDPLIHSDSLVFEDEQILEFKKLGWSLPVILGEDIVGENNDFRLKTVPRIAFDSSAIWPFLAKNVVSVINKNTEDVKIYKDEKGEVVIEGRGENGLSVESAKLVAGMNLALNTGIRGFEIPVHEDKAKVNISDELKDLGIKELLATGHTSYYGSPPNRMHNINVGIQKYNGLLVKPGEQFSFNKYLGQVDYSSGYLPEKVIKQNKIELEVGGGICQVSTTLYRAALWAGLPIIERAPHSWKVTYYSQIGGHGLDATIYPGSHDLKFLNDTPSYLLIQAYDEGSNAYFKFYGTNDGRSVALDGPHGGGMNYIWYRLITKDGQTKKEPIASTYKPIPPPTQQTQQVIVSSTQQSVPANVQPASTLKTPVKTTVAPLKAI